MVRGTPYSIHEVRGTPYSIHGGILYGVPGTPADITYGTALSGTQLDATASVPGVFTYTPAAGVVLGAGAGQSLAVNFAPTDSANYTTATGSALINVAKATPVITWASPADIDYGTPLSGTQLDASANIPGTFSYLPAAGTLLAAVSGQMLAATFTPTDLTDYAATPVSTTINVAKAMPVLKLSDPGGVYDGAPFVASVTVAGVGADGASSAKLEGVAPTLTYYSGSGTTGPNLGTAALRRWVSTRSSRASPVRPITRRFSRLRSHSRSAAGTDAIGLSVSTGPSIYGESVTLTARVSSSLTPGGTVTFFDGGAVLGTVTLDGSGAAVLTTSALAVGEHSVTATYSGDASLPGATSGAVIESVGQSGTTIVLVPDPVRKKKKIKSEILMAEIDPVSPGGGVPTGTVIFELVTKKNEKDRDQDAGCGEREWRRGHVDAEAEEGARQGDHDRLQRRREFPGEHAGRARSCRRRGCSDLAGSRS